MVHTGLRLAISAVLLITDQTACAMSPAEVPNSPISPLADPVERHAAEPNLRTRTIGPNLLARDSLPKLPTPRAPATYKLVVQRVDLSGAEQGAIWNSSATREARSHILEFCRRAKQTSPVEGEAFLECLVQLPAPEMQAWLDHYQLRRAAINSQRQVEQLGRQVVIEQALLRQAASRQGAANASRHRAEATVAMQLQRQVGSAIARLIPQSTATSVTMLPSYNPMDATTDPMNPHGYRRRVAAAMTLPGDLPRNDPRNYDRHAADYGEWATTRTAEPPVQ